jgi:hypothetical protein
MISYKSVQNFRISTRATWPSAYPEQSRRRLGVSIFREARTGQVAPSLRAHLSLQWDTEVLIPRPKRSAEFVEPCVTKI